MIERKYISREEAEKMWPPKGLMRCPFCGSKSVYQQGGDYGFAVLCNCGASGPTACEDDDEGEEIARNLWNERDD